TYTRERPSLDDHEKPKGGILRVQVSGNPTPPRINLILLYPYTTFFTSSCSFPSLLQPSGHAPAILFASAEHRTREGDKKKHASVIVLSIYFYFESTDNESSLTALLDALSALDDLCGVIEEKYEDASRRWTAVAVIARVDQRSRRTQIQGETISIIRYTPNVLVHPRQKAMRPQNKGKHLVRGREDKGSRTRLIVLLSSHLVNPTLPLARRLSTLDGNTFTPLHPNIFSQIPTQCGARAGTVLMEGEAVCARVAHNHFQIRQRSDSHHPSL
ncbi:1360_t:CDS:2, partial [Acaulospora colombiana]